jgi:hypothetical protein
VGPERLRLARADAKANALNPNGLISEEILDAALHSLAHEFSLPKKLQFLYFIETLQFLDLCGGGELSTWPRGAFR